MGNRCGQRHARIWNFVSALLADSFRHSAPLAGSRRFENPTAATVLTVSRPAAPVARTWRLAKKLKYIRKIKANHAKTSPGLPMTFAGAVLRARVPSRTSTLEHVSWNASSVSRGKCSRHSKTFHAFACPLLPKLSSRHARLLNETMSGDTNRPVLTCC